jgi:hypothetical protein
VNKSGYVHVVDFGNSLVQVFNPAGTFVGQWGVHGSGNGQFSFPTGIAVNPNGYTYVTDSGNNRVQVFNPGGAYVRQGGWYGTLPGYFDNPNGIAVNATGYVYVTDKNNDRVEVFYCPILQVTSPNGGETWKRGSPHTITWKYSGNPEASVRIELLKGTAVNRVISAGTSLGSGGSGSFPWTILSTQGTGTTYRIRINSTSNAAVTDTGDGTFTISA